MALVSGAMAAVLLLVVGLVGCGGGLDRSEDDVVCALFFELRERSMLGAFAVGRDRDDRADADDDAQCREQRPQLVQQQVGQAESECFD